MSFKTVMIEVSGRCNAFCKYCYTGRANRDRGFGAGKFLSPQNLERALQYLFENGFADSSTRFGLYNFGEPLLHPQFTNIVKIFHEANVAFEISTNGSVPLKSDALRFLDHMDTFKFSMCGFSDESYARISKLDFEEVKENIVRALKLLRDNSWNGVASLKFHVYKYNQDEILAARDFALENGMMFSPIHAIIGDLLLQTEFVEGRLPQTFLKEISDDLLSADMFARYAAQKPQHWHCPLSDELVIDEDLNVLNCCMSSRNDMEDYQWHGSLFNMHNMNTERCTSPLAQRCLNSGAAYAFCHFPTHRAMLPVKKILSILNSEDVCVLGDNEVYASFCELFSKLGATWVHFSSVKAFVSSDCRSLPLIVASAKFKPLLKELYHEGIPPSQVKEIYHFNVLLREDERI